MLSSHSIYFPALIQTLQQKRVEVTTLLQNSEEHINLLFQQQQEKKAELNQKRAEMQALRNQSYLLKLIPIEWLSTSLPQLTQKYNDLQTECAALRQAIFHFEEGIQLEKRNHRIHQQHLFRIEKLSAIFDKAQSQPDTKLSRYVTMQAANSALAKLDEELHFIRNSLYYAKQELAQQPMADEILRILTDEKLSHANPALIADLTALNARLVKQLASKKLAALHNTTTELQTFISRSSAASTTSEALITAATVTAEAATAATKTANIELEKVKETIGKLLATAKTEVELSVVQSQIIQLSAIYEKYFELAEAEQANKHATAKLTHHATTTDKIKAKIRALSTKTYLSSNQQIELATLKERLIRAGKEQVQLSQDQVNYARSIQRLQNELRSAPDYRTVQHLLLTRQSEQQRLLVASSKSSPMLELRNALHAALKTVTAPNNATVCALNSQEQALNALTAFRHNAVKEMQSIAAHEGDLSQITALFYELNDYERQLLKPEATAFQQSQTMRQIIDSFEACHREIVNNLDRYEAAALENGDSNRRQKQLHYQLETEHNFLTQRQDRLQSLQDRLASYNPDIEDSMIIREAPEVTKENIEKLQSEINALQAAIQQSKVNIASLEKLTPAALYFAERIQHTIAILYSQKPQTEKTKAIEKLSVELTTLKTAKQYLSTHASEHDAIPATEISTLPCPAGGQIISPTNTTSCLSEGDTTLPIQDAATVAYPSFSNSTITPTHSVVAAPTLPNTPKEFILPKPLAIQYATHHPLQDLQGLLDIIIAEKTRIELEPKRFDIDANKTEQKLMAIRQFLAYVETRVGYEDELLDELKHTILLAKAGNLPKEGTYMSDSQCVSLIRALAVHRGANLSWFGQRTTCMEQLIACANPHNSLPAQATKASVRTAYETTHILYKARGYHPNSDSNPTVH